MHIQIGSFEGWRSSSEPPVIVSLLPADAAKSSAGSAASVYGDSPFPDRSSASAAKKLCSEQPGVGGAAAALPRLTSPVVADQQTLSKALADESAITIGGAEAGHNAAVTMPSKIKHHDEGDMLALRGVLALPPLAADTTDPAILAARLQLRPSGTEQLNEGLFHYLITRPWVTDTIDGVQYFCAEQVSTALSEEHKAACCRQQVKVLQAAFDHESQYLAMLLHGTAKQRTRDGYTEPHGSSSVSERVSALVQHIVNSEPADLLQDHSHQSLAHALGMSQASMPPALGVALQRLRERHFQLRAAELAAQAVAADAKVYRDAASQIVYQSHGIMCLLTLTENSTWDPMRDVPRLQYARQQLQSQEQVWGLLSALQDSQCWWATPAAHAAVGEGYTSFLRQCVRLAVRTAMQTREAQSDALRQRISIIASSCLQSAEQLGRVMSQQEYAAATRLLPPPPPLPAILDAAMQGADALNPFIPLVADAPPSHPFAPPSAGEALGPPSTQSATATAPNLPPAHTQSEPDSSLGCTDENGAQSGAGLRADDEDAEEDGIAAASLSTMQAGAEDGQGLPDDIMALIEQEMRGLAPPLSFDEQRGVLTLAARLGGEHDLLAKGVPPPMAYPPSAVDCLPWAAGDGPRGSQEGARSFDRLAYPEPPPAGPGPSEEEVLLWIRHILQACGVSEALVGVHCVCICLTIQRALVASDLLRQAHGAKVVSDQLKDLPLIAITPASWRGIILGACLAWVGCSTDSHSADSLLGAPERTTQPAIVAAKAAIVGMSAPEPSLEPEGAVPRVPRRAALCLTGEDTALQWPTHWQGTQWGHLVSSEVALASPLAALREWVSVLCAACPQLQASHSRAAGLRSMGRLPVDAPWQVAGSGVRATPLDTQVDESGVSLAQANAIPARELQRALERMEAFCV